MKKQYFLLSLLTMSFSGLLAQEYWQQEVNYKIDVKLDDVNHMIRASETFEYINHSPDKLDKIYIHLWPNAYRGKRSALAKQLYKNGEEFLTFADDKDKGWIDSLDFKVNGEPVKWEYHPDHMDVGIIYLTQPLNPGAKIIVSTPFKVKLPSGKISRLGHIDQSYQITQWYPKPAVYDKNGWNWMPYLNQGEFYSEYGSFDVSITLPKNYIVGATGDLQTASELQFLEEQVAATKLNPGRLDKPSNMGGFKKVKNADNEFPASSAEYKTIRFTQSKVHDFAWFADKRFKVLKGEVELPHSKRKVTSWAMYVPGNAKLWQKAIEYINDGTYYYSKWNGDYPYNNVTAIDGTISAGGGMEYPNVTVIGNCSSAMELEIVIVHEVGHNWFYGILGSNERIHGWMDEGMNTLNEMRYIATKYPDNKNMSDMVFGGKFHLNDLDHHDMGDISYRFMAMQGEDQPIETKSADFTAINYGIIMYQKTGLVFFYLKDYLGEEAFNKAMSDYFEAYKFKHPQPEDMRRVLEASTGKDLGWLFNDLIQTTNHIDYKLKKVSATGNGTSVTVKNVGQVDGPIGVSALKNGQVVETAWIEPGSGKTTTVTLKTTDPDQVQIDPNRNIPEIDRSNNNWSAKGGKMEPLKLELFFGDNERDKSNNFWMPALGYNNNDQFMLGVAVHNLGVPFRKFQYFVAPMYSFGRNFVSGTGEFSYTFLPKSFIKLTRVGVSLRSFKNENSRKDNDSYYAAAMPYIYFKFGERKNDIPFTENMLIQTIYNYTKFAPFDRNQAGAYLKYTANYDKPNFQMSGTFRTDFMMNVEFQDDYVARSSFEAVLRYKYLKNKTKTWIELRGFFGKVWNDNVFDVDKRFSLAGTSGAQDIFLEDYYFERSGYNVAQGGENMGNFKLSGVNYITTDRWIATGNLYVELPYLKVIGAYADFGGLQQGSTMRGFANFGVGMRLGKVFGLYFPLYMSQNLSDLYVNKNYGEKIRFTLRLNMVNKPFSLKSFMQ